jgi:adenine-specific DNA-methyltransferase
LGEQILKNGEIVEKFKDRPFAQQYLELKRQLDETEITETIQNQVFNDLYEFFSRYYEDGDFISKRRRGNKYVIPYGGEEVKLYWANFDQYYVKTGEVFKDYNFDLKGWKIIFRTIFAEVEVGNIKGERKYFLKERQSY